MKKSAELAKLLFEVLEEVSEAGQDKVIDNLVNLLKKEDELYLLPEIYRELESLIAQKQGTNEITTAKTHVVSKSDLKKLQDLAGVSLKENLDEEIIGGTIIQIHDQSIDASIKTSLSQLKKSMESHHD